MIDNKKTFKFNPICVAMLSILFVAGCGGGGGGGSSSTVGSDQKNTGGTGNNKNIGNTSSNKIKVGVIDSGAVDENVLKDSIVKIQKFKDDGSSTDIALNASPEDQDVYASVQHGSFVSSVISGSNYNGSTEGLAYGKADLYEAQVTSSSGDSYDNRNFKAMLSLQKNYGVNIFNNSWGLYKTDGNYSGNLSAVSLAKQVVENGGLMFFATGNSSSRKNPSFESLLPTYDASIKKGLVAVTGVDADKTTIDVDANVCGDAAEWCVAGDYYSHDYYIERFKGLYVYAGTSGATPEVTAEAALIAYKYGWMNNENIKYTILTTADYLDDGSKVNTPYNSTYGWGYYDIDKALNGPSKFYSGLGDFNADVLAGYDSTFSNDIDGDAGLVKSGDGKLTLSGKDSYSGNTQITGGTLSITGSLTNSAVTVNNGGTLSGTGSVKSVQNDGVVSTEEGGLSVSGDYTQGSDGELNYYLNNPLSVSGSATLSGSLNVYSKNSVFGNGSYTVVKGDNINGQFSSVNSGSSFLKVNSVGYGADQVSADVSLVDASTAGTSASSGESKVGGALINQVLSKASTDKSASSDLVSYASDVESTSSADQAQSVLNSQTGVIYSEVPAIMLNNQSVENGIVSQHVYETTKNDRSGVWFNATGMNTKNKADGWNTASTSSYNYMVGGDVKANNSVMFGGAVSKNTLNSKVSDGAGSADTKMNTFTGYVKAQDAGHGLYGLAVGSYGYGNTEIKRDVVTGSNSYKNDNTTDVKVASAYAETGYDYSLPDSAFSLSPFMGLGYSYAKVNGLTEGSVYGLRVGSTHIDQVELTEGLRAAYRLSENVEFHGYVARKDILGNNTSMQHVSMNVSSDISADYQTPEFEKGSYVYDIGASYSPYQSLTFTADLTGINGKSDSYAAQLGAKYSF